MQFKEFNTAYEDSTQRIIFRHTLMGFIREDKNHLERFEIKIVHKTQLLLSKCVGIVSQLQTSVSLECTHNGHKYSIF